MGASHPGLGLAGQAGLQRGAPPAPLRADRVDAPSGAGARTRDIRFPPQGSAATAVLNGLGRHSRTHPAIKHVATHFDRKIALEDVAALCRLSPTQFCRVFRQEQATSFGQYLLRYRLARACESLAHPGALAKEVAYAVGFNDLSYFTWAFKRQLGLTPSEYRGRAR